MVVVVSGILFVFYGEKYLFFFNGVVLVLPAIPSFYSIRNTDAVSDFFATGLHLGLIFSGAFCLCSSPRKLDGIFYLILYCEISGGKLWLIFL